MPKHCSLYEEFATQSLAERVEALEAAAGPAGDNDADAIHDVRVASRRIRSHLRAHKKTFKKKVLEEFQCRVRAVTRGLGTARELDVTVDLLSQRRKTLKGPARTAATKVLRALRAERQDEDPNVDASVHLIQDGRFSTSLEKLLSNVKSRKRCYADAAAANLNKRLDKVVAKNAMWIESHGDEDLHQVRIAFKRLRYTCEVFHPLYDEPMTTFLAILKETQQTLGDWNDIRILRDHVERLAKKLDRDAREGISALHSQLDREVDALRESYERTSTGFFSEPAIDRVRALFAAVECPCCASSPAAKS
ncbi:MAG: hypothetical protein AMXMBFR82_05910 [Candidatus Hydrogenedentota bacterium]